MSGPLGTKTHQQGGHLGTLSKFVLWLTPACLYAANYTVKAAGGGDYTTIQACANATAAGDTCTVFAGTYAERVTPPTSGSTGLPITFQVNPGDTVVMQGFSITSKSYITIGGSTSNSGFEVTATAGTPLVLLTTADHITIQNNYLHHGGNGGICVRFAFGSTSSYVTIQNNMLSWCGDPPLDPADGIQVRGDHVLIQGNTINHVADFITVYTASALVVRNNTLGPMSDADFPGTSNQLHVDGVQLICATGATIVDVVIEGNTMDSIDVDDSHLALFSATGGTHCGERSIARLNVASSFGGPIVAIVQGDSFYPVKLYGNTFANIGLRSANASTFNIVNSNPNNAVINNLFYSATTNNGSVYTVSVGSGTGFVGKNNLGYNASCGGSCTWVNPINSESGAVLNQDPLFVPGALRLQGGSPARGAGSFLTAVATADSGSGTSLVVDDAAFFQDGYGIVNSDWIRIGSTTTAQIASIDYGTNTITLAAGITRNDGDPVYLFKNSSGVPVLLDGQAPDIGAFPYIPSGSRSSGPITRAGPITVK
jgi:hypothetical protein